MPGGRPWGGEEGGEGGGAGIWDEPERWRPGPERGCGRVERGEPMGWRTGRGRNWSGPRAFRTALAGGGGGRSGQADGLEPEALGRPR